VGQLTSCTPSSRLTRWVSNSVTVKRHEQYDTVDPLDIMFIAIHNINILNLDVRALWLDDA